MMIVWAPKTLGDPCRRRCRPSPSPAEQQQQQQQPFGLSDIHTNLGMRDGRGSLAGPVVQVLDVTVMGYLV